MFASVLRIILIFDYGPVATDVRLGSMVVHDRDTESSSFLGLMILAVDKAYRSLSLNVPWLFEMKSILFKQENECKTR